MEITPETADAAKTLQQRMQEFFKVRRRIQATVLCIQLFGGDITVNLTWQQMMENTRVEWKRE